MVGSLVEDDYGLVNALHVLNERTVHELHSPSPRHLPVMPIK